MGPHGIGYKNNNLISSEYKIVMRNLYKIILV